jgi:glycosyltransferase involved in cell wall biosynthesis
MTKEKGVDLLAEAFLDAHERDPRLHLVLAGGGPESEALQARLGEHATFLGWLSGQELARAYASADMFLFASQTDTFGQVILEAQASGLPVVAVNEGGPRSLITDAETGLLAPADPHLLADRLIRLVRTPLLAERLRKTALAQVRERTWERSMERLAAGYRSALLRAPAAQPARDVA